ncbi:transcriptional regulator [Lacrimispora defluvii]|uniref:Transcriptional regulator n=1 Tax=Lacrimispora defluvii TaxID=2719233 RepID=A0ABX1VWJ9_9FIRM|nr:transcriptional regulator [Lacrimispora defluvii]NNJ31775.1 transcriptional regulator [Lacrimispora defluvii]
MKIKLGIITPETHMDYFRVIEEEMRSVCQFRFLTISNFRETKDVYLKNLGLVDGFVISGRFLYESIDKECLDAKVPTHILQDNENLLYRELFRLLVTEPELDISRIYVDYAYIIDSFSEFQKYLTHEGKPVDSNDFFERVETMLENHITLWEEKKTDLSITAFGHFVPELKKHGVRYILIRPTLENMKETITEIINEITILKLKNQRAVVACLSMETLQPPETEQLQELKDLVSRFLLSVNLADTAQISEKYVRLYTTYGSFMKITSDAHNCTLLEYLDESVSETVKIGWGSGHEYYQANENATKAYCQAKAFSGSCSFFINEDQKVIGPMKSMNVIQFSEQGDPEIIALAKSMGINNINLQKIISYAGIMRTNKLSSEDVAQCLSMTVRGANRILNKIEEKNYVQTVFEKRDNSKGRPKKYYELLFLDEDGNRSGE